MNLLSRWSVLAIAAVVDVALHSRSAHTATAPNILKMMDTEGGDGAVSSAAGGSIPWVGQHNTAWIARFGWP
jgi:hypothetical protein